MRQYPIEIDIINMNKILNGEDVIIDNKTYYEEKHWEEFDEEKKEKILKMIKENFKIQKTFSYCVYCNSFHLARRFGILLDCKIHSDIIKKAMILCGYNAKTTSELWRFNVNYSSVVDMCEKYNFSEKMKKIRKEKKEE